MPTLLYIHGFLSSPHSAKAQSTQVWLQANRPAWRYCCPFLSSYPKLAEVALLECVRDLEGEAVYLIGSSLGGFWANYLTEKFGFKAVLVNPAVHPHQRFQNLAGQTLHNYHTGEACILLREDVNHLAACEPATIADPSLYWLIVQKGDETLDYRDAVLRYQACRQTVEEGGNHSFDGFEAWLPKIIEFFESSTASANLAS